MPEATTNEIGIKETGEVVDFIGDVGEAVGRSLEDHKLGLADLRHVIGLRGPAIAALKDVRKVKAELMDLTLDEADSLLKRAEAAKSKIDFMIQTIVNFKNTSAAE